jgi:hypothetical protein
MSTPYVTTGSLIIEGSTFCGGSVKNAREMGVLSDMVPNGGSIMDIQKVSKIAQIVGTENLRYCNYSTNGQLNYTREVITSYIPKFPVVFKMYDADSYINFDSSFIVAGEIQF